MKRTSLLAAVTSVALLGFGAAPAVAATADDPVLPSVGSVHSETSDPGTVLFTAASDSAITSITATLTPRNGSEPTTVETAAFELVSGTDTDGTWRTKDQVDLPDYDYYDVSVDVTDADGDHPATPGTGELNYNLWPVITADATSPAVLDYEHRQVTATGEVKTLDPKTGETSAPWTGKTVTVALGDFRESGQTDSEGHYSVSVAPSSFSDSLAEQVHVPVAETEVVGQVTNVGFNHTATRIVLDHPSVRANYGSKLSISGVVQYHSGTSWKPLAGAHVALNGSIVQTSNAAGRFTYGLQAVPVNDATWHVQLRTGDLTGGFFLNASTAPLAINTINRITLTWTTAFLNEYSELHVQGRMTSSNGHLPANRKVYIQQSSNGRSGWRTLGYLVAAGGTGNYNVEGYVQHPSGYWRLYYPVQGDFQQALSRVVHLSRYDTQVAGYKVSPTKVRKGKQVTVSGTLQKLTSPKWTAFGKQKVYLLFRAKGGSSYALAGTVATTSKGKFSKKVKPARDGYFLAVWLTPNSRYVDAVSKEVFVDVR